MQIANTTANLSAKTVLAAENANTITGLQTFDRDPSAPFAVTASSAVVTNLDADKLDGLDSTAFLLVDKLADSTFNDGSAHDLAAVDSRSGRLVLTAGAQVTTIPFYGNAGGGVAYRWTVLDPDTGWIINGSGFGFSFQDGSGLNTYTVAGGAGTGRLSIQRTAGTTQYRAVVVADPVL